MFRVNNKDARTTSLTYFLTYSTSFSNVPIVVFEQVNVGWGVIWHIYLDSLVQNMVWRNCCTDFRNAAGKLLVLYGFVNHVSCDLPYFL